MSELDCVACGACCQGLTVFLDAEDEARLSVDEVLALTELDAEGRVRSLRQREGGRCVALRVEAGRFLCSIYDRRPDACAAFERGSRRCHEWRERQGRAPLVR